MKLGLFMMPLHPPGRTLSESYDEDLGLIKHAIKLDLVRYGLVNTCCYHGKICQILNYLLPAP